MKTIGNISMTIYMFKFVFLKSGIIFYFIFQLQLQYSFWSSTQSRNRILSFIHRYIFGIQRNLSFLIYYNQGQVKLRYNQERCLQYTFSLITTYSHKAVIYLIYILCHDMFCLLPYVALRGEYVSHLLYCVLTYLGYIFYGKSEKYGNFHIRLKMFPKSKLNLP